MARYCNIFLCALVLWLPYQTCAQNPAVVRRVEITSTRSEPGRPIRVHKELSPSGPGGPDRADLVIHKEGDKYYLDDKVVDANLIAALAKALTEDGRTLVKMDFKVGQGGKVIYLYIAWLSSF